MTYWTGEYSHESIGCTNTIYIPHSAPTSYQSSCWWWKLQNSIFWSAFYLPYCLQIYSSSIKKKKKKIPDPGKPVVLPLMSRQQASHSLLRGFSLARPCEESWAGLIGLWQGEEGGCESLAQCSCRLPAQRLLISANWHSWWQAWVGAGKRKKVLLSARLQVCCPWAKVQPFEY